MSCKETYFVGYTAPGGMAHTSGAGQMPAIPGFHPGVLPANDNPQALPRARVFAEIKWNTPMGNLVKSIQLQAAGPK
jgi:hypothetical protein